MCRQSQFKYVSCGEDPEMLFDLENDPSELNNLALQTAYSDILLRMRKQVDKQWNKSELTANVFASQQKRLFVQEAMKNGTFPSWDYTPLFDASRSYVRGAIDPNTTATKARKRFPFVPTTKPEKPRVKNKTE